WSPCARRSPPRSRRGSRRRSAAQRGLLRQQLGRRLAGAVHAMRAVLRAVLALSLAGLERCEIGEDLVRPLEPLAVVRHEQRDLVLVSAILLSRRHLLRDEVEAELRQPLADGGRVWAPLGLVEREHEAMLDAARAG